MEPSTLRYGLLANHSRLVLKLDPLAMLPFLISDGLVNLDEKEMIQNKTTGGVKTDALLTLIHRKGMSDSTVYERFMKILADESLSGGQHLEKLAAKVREDSTDPEVIERYHPVPSRLDPVQKAALLSGERQLICSLNVEDIAADLVSLGVLSLDENEVIRSGVTYNDRAQLLVQLMHQKGSEQFVRFVETLVASEHYSELGRRLLLERVKPSEGEHKINEKYVTEVLKRGHVPPRHSVYVDRPELTNCLRKQLRKLQNSDGWVVVHGMAGFGKTILAAEAIRDATLLQEVFPGGVHWLPVGQMVTKDGDIDQAKLLTRLQNLIVRLDDSVTRPPNLEAANNTLQRVLSEHYPHCLLVLDDIWSPEVAQAFSVRCSTMVTSRNSAVASMVQTPLIIPVPITIGLSNDEGMLLLAQWLDWKPSELPTYAEAVIEYCKGSPMVIALIGAILKKNPSSERKWKVIVEKLRNRHFHSIKLHATVNEWSYQHATLNASIELSVENLPRHLQELFEMFVVFDYNTLVSSRALETIWNRDSLETEELLMELVGLSLVQKAPPSDDDTEYIVFLVHDIVLDYLHQKVPPKKQVEHHAAVVKHYLENEGAHTQIYDDGYVYKKLLGHISASGNYELLGDLLSQLPWLISTAKSGNAMSMLAVYRCYKAKIPEQFVPGVQQFEFFMSGHMDILANNPSHDEILQLALLQPNSSEVFIQASARVCGDRKKSWFKWSNKESDPEKYVLKLKLHRAGVKKCQYSRDGLKVVSCSNDSGIKLWDASTGMELADFRGHNDMVTCCALSDSGRLVISSSEDNTVRVWETHSKTNISGERVKKSPLILEFKGHQYGVQCCAIAPDEGLVISADIDSCVMVWEPLTGKVVSKWRLSSPSPMVSPVLMESQPSFPAVYQPLQSTSPSLGTEGVLSCAFSPNGSFAVTGTQTGSILLWRTDGYLLCSLVGHKYQVRCCVFDKTGSFLATACLGDSSAKDSSVKIWGISSHKCIHTLVHSCPVLSCDFSPDQERLVTGNTAGVVLIWSVSDGTQLEEYFLHSDHVNCVLYSPTQPHILSAADNGIIKIQWNDSSGGALSPYLRGSHTHYHRRFSVHFSKNAGYSVSILCYAKKQKKLQLVQGPQANVTVPALPILADRIPRSWNLSTNGSLVVIGFEDGALQVISALLKFESTQCHELWHIEDAHKSAIKKAFFSPDDTIIVTCSEDQHKTWCAKSGDSLAAISGSGVGVKPVIFFQDSQKVASAQEKGVLVWHAKTGAEDMKCMGIVDSEESVVLCLNLSKNNCRLVASNSAGLVMVWSIQTGDPLLQSAVPPLAPCARSCALSQDGSLAAAGFDDGSLKIWHVSSLSSSSQIAHCHTNSSYWMIDVGFSPNGETIVTLCDTIEWWDRTGKHMKTMYLKGSFGKYIRYSPDFCTFVTIDNVGLLYILDTII